MKTYRDIPGDGGSNVVEQIVSQRKQIDFRLSKIKHLVAVGSGKGGVGKSTLSLTLALACRALGKTTAVLDADFNGPSIAALAGLTNSAPLPGIDGMIPPQTKDAVAIFSTGTLMPEGAALEFDSVLQGDSFVWRATKEFSTLAEILAGCDWGERDILFVDLPPGPERTLQFVDFFGARTNVLLVTIPTDVATSVVRRGKAALTDTNARILGYVENMAGYLSPATNTLEPLFPSSANTGLAQFDLEKLGALPFDPALAAACNSGLDLAGLASVPSSSQIMALAQKLLTTLEERDEVSVRQM